jgi:oligopeptide transport system permease protein
MFALFCRRVLWLIPVVFTVAVITFLLMHRAPGGPWDTEKPVPAAARATLNARFDLDKPLWLNRSAIAAAWAAGERNPVALGQHLLDSQFCHYLANLARLDLGPSYQSKGTVDVQTILADRFPTSAKLGLVGVAVAIVVGVPLGVAGALRHNTWVDYLCLTASTLGTAVPTFVSGVLLLLVLSSTVGLAPLRRPEEWDGLGPAYLLPGIVLGLGTMAYLARLSRTALLEVKGQDFVRTARAKGLRERRVIGGHMLRNALIPVVTVLGPAAADLITGSFIIETIFNVPGMGRAFVESIGKRDYSMIMGTTLFYALLVALANVLVDLSYGVVDPRIRDDAL